MSNIELYNDNCINVMKNLKQSSVDLILTDPPYNLGKFMKDRQTNLKKMRENFFGAAGWDDLEYEDWIEHMEEFFELSSKVLKKGGALLIFMSLLKVESIVKIAEKYKFYYKTTGVWHKLNPMPRNMNLHFINSTEAWIYFINNGRTGTFNNNGKPIHDFIETALTPMNEKKYGKHPTQKPEQLLEHFIKVLSNENDTVLDPFMGSGTTGKVAKQNNRNFIGIELSKDYFEIAKKRINDVETVTSEMGNIKNEIACN
ncbi:DNA-methyltransferase [Heyndrickxia coagulans]|jgi:site-specific DNA-methyltransferase (adenine-specific)|uniref:DNA-methyltransferase n=1 Tax=Heyndrickxia TaxID=2837504 RepID=UPI000795EF28|nr:site-specific DNA-methyltransferase [Heyndrickxia coagulans]KYC60139.1 Adenine-specific methyltransferase [Heyndrickxia coagulans]UXC21884.1 site-specific DNA-methyltransferase [Heyndrickxia coagulans]